MEVEMSVTDAVLRGLGEKPRYREGEWKPTTGFSRDMGRRWLIEQGCREEIAEERSIGEQRGREVPLIDCLLQPVIVGGLAKKKSGNQEPCGGG
jgi:hypothetical protein